MKQEKWYKIGYYIVEPVTKLEGISLPCKQILSASNCISIHHPDLDEFFWLGREEKARKYQEKFGLSDCAFLQLKEDISGFHSYLCNGLEKTIEADYLLKVDYQGLIQNPYEEVVDFAKRIEGMGEPVEWIPVAVYDCAES